MGKIGTGDPGTLMIFLRVPSLSFASGLCTVSDLATSNSTAPNCPLDDPPGVAGEAAKWSLSTTVSDYIAAGVAPG